MEEAAGCCGGGGGCGVDAEGLWGLEEVDEGEKEDVKEEEEDEEELKWVWEVVLRL